MNGMPHPKMDWSAPNLHETWKKFKNHSELMFKGPFKKTEGEERVAYVLIWIGEKGRDIHQTWNLSEDEQKDVDVIYEKFDEYFEPKQNYLFSRYNFQKRTQKENESIDDFVTDLQLMVKPCSYKEPDSMVRDKIVCGILSSKIREKLLIEGDNLTLEKAVEIAKTHETTKGRLKEMAASSSENDVDALRRHPQPAVRHHKFSQERCRHCGTHHAKGNCAAKGKQCLKCNKWNHFANVCESKNLPMHKQRSRIHEVHPHKDDEDEEDSADDFTIDAVNKARTKCDQVFADIILGNEQPVHFKLDTGAQVSVLPRSVYNSIPSASRPKLQKTDERLTGYSGQALKVNGFIHMKCTYKKRSVQSKLFVVETNSPPVASLQLCLDLELIKLILSVDKPTSKMTADSVLTEYADVFSGIGNFGESKIELKPDSKPVVHAPRRVPHSLRENLKKELNRMETADVISKVTEPTDWVNSLVIVEKPETRKMRVCLDPRDLNNAIKRPHYRMPTLDDVVSRLNGAKYFSKLDARSGYWNIKLEEESSFLTTFNTPFGRYRFKRMPFGLVSAQDEFQRLIDEALGDLDGVFSLIDDILITGRTIEEHDANLRAVLERCKKINLKLNRDKLVIGATEVKYFGHIIGADGLKPDPQKIEAINNMAAPTNKKELETMLGMVTYLSKFAPSLSEVTAPLRDLLKQDSEFQWDTQHDEAWKKTKQVITSQPVLAFFDPKKTITLQVDASQNGLGASLFQEDKLVACASKALTPTEKNYAQIEKELYAILFGCRRFHDYVYGHQVIVQSDQKPLEIIFKKPLHAAPPRLQRMLLQLQRYQLKIVYTPGKDIAVADALSRHFLPDTCDDSISQESQLQVHAVVSRLPATDERLEQLRQSTQECEEMKTLKAAIMNGWPETIQECPHVIKSYFNHRDEMTVTDGIIVKGERLVIPPRLREEMLEKIHSSHFGMDKCKQRARDILFWPGMSADIERIVSQCSVCAERQPSNAKEPLSSHEIPSRPWQKVATDLFQWNGNNYMVTVDYYSRFFEIDQLTTTTSSAVVHKLSVHFARHGVPEIVVSDNGPQYSSEEFSVFAKKWSFQHITSSPKYPQSNGLAERYVRICKDILNKARDTGTPPLMCLLEYRNTPVDNLASPAQLLMGRRLRSSLPTYSKRLEPKVITPSTVMTKRADLQRKQKSYYDRTTRPLRPLQKGDNVRVQKENGQWKPAVITQCGKHRSYTVKTSTGAVLRRNRRHLKPDNTLLKQQGQNGQTSTYLHFPDEQGENFPEYPLPDENPDGLYITRSGRHVRPPKRLDL